VKLKVSFQTWIFIGCLAVVLCTLALTAVVAEGFLRGQFTRRARASLLTTLAAVRFMAAETPLGERSRPSADQWAKRLGRQLGLRVTVIAADGVVVGDTNVPPADLADLDNHAGRPEVLEALARGTGSSLRYSRTLGLDLVYAAAVVWPRLGPVWSLDGPRFYVRLALPLSAVARVIGRMRRLLLVALLWGLLVSFVVAYLVSRRLSAPVKELAATARRITAGEVAPRFRLYPEHEVGDLGRALDEMSTHLASEIRKVSEGRDRLAAVLDGVVEGVLVLDRNGQATIANRALSLMLELDVDPIGRKTPEIVRNADLIEAVQAALAGAEPATVEMRTYGRPPRYLEVHVVGLPGQAPLGGAVAVFHDITARERVDRMRRDFVANVSHELRTPLTAVRAAVETLRDGALEDPTAGVQFVSVIKRHVDRLENILRDLLDLARLESATFESPREMIDLAAVIRPAMNTVADLARSRDVELVGEGVREEVSLCGDSRLLDQAVLNLLHNAIIYNDPGGRVVLRLSQSPTQIFISVEDTGIGIAPENLDRVFERFYRVNKDRSRRLGGTGLGLAIVKHVAQLHGGRVEVTSRVGVGSTFTIILNK
jgi:two-component system phosphate regulon sensor histidine kinase PhoR